MHDPSTVAFEIRYPWRKYGRSGKTEFDRNYRESFITIWHEDPEKDGTDDSCGWFKRARHGDKETLRRITSEFSFAWDAEHSGWFDSDGEPRYSSMAIVLGLFRLAAWVHYNRDHRKADRFMKRNLYDILAFAENPVDSMHSAIVSKYGLDRKDYRVDQAASIIYGWILRAERPWWRHPRWHLHHWRLQIHPWQQLKRRFWDRCCKCGKRGFPNGVAAMGNWSGDQIWHSTCDEVRPAMPSPPVN